MPALQLGLDSLRPGRRLCVLRLLNDLAIKVYLVHSHAEEVSHGVRVIGARHLVFLVPGAVIPHIPHGGLVRLLDLGRKGGKGLHPLRDELAAFLCLDGAGQLLSEVVGADGLQDFILQLRVFDLVQIHVIHEVGTTAHGSLEFLLVELQQLHSAPDGRLGEARLPGNLVNTVPQVEHHLEALGLLVKGEVGPLNVLHEHGLHLRPEIHVSNDAGKLLQTGQLRGCKAPVADDDRVAFLPSVARNFPLHHPWNNGQILEDTVGLDAVGQFGQVAQVFPGVVGMGVELFDGDVDQAVRGVVIAQGCKESFVHSLPILPVADRLLVVDVVALAGVCRIVGAFQFLADEVALLPLTFDLQRAAVVD